MKQQEGNLKGKNNSERSLRVWCILERSHEQITPTSRKFVSAFFLPCVAEKS